MSNLTILSLRFENGKTTFMGETAIAHHFTIHNYPIEHIDVLHKIASSFSDRIKGISGLSISVIFPRNGQSAIDCEITLNHASIFQSDDFEKFNNSIFFTSPLQEAIKQFMHDTKDGYLAYLRLRKQTEDKSEIDNFLDEFLTKIGLKKSTDKKRADIFNFLTEGQL